MVLDGLNHGCRGISDTGGPMINYVWINPRVIQGWSVNSEFPPGKELKDLNHPTSYRESPHSFNRGNKEGKKSRSRVWGLCRLSDPTRAMTKPSCLSLYKSPHFPPAAAVLLHRLVVVLPVFLKSSQYQPPLPCKELCIRPSLPQSSFFFFSFIFISWRLITLQHCSGFCHTLTWISHGFTYMCYPSWSPLLPPSPSHPSGSSQCTSTCLMHPTWAGDLFHPW